MSNRDLLNEFLEYKQNISMCSDQTIRAYRNDLNQFADFLLKNEVSILESSTMDIQDYLSEVGKNKNISTSSMARKLASIKSLYRYLANNKIISKNISRLIKSPKIPKRLPNFLTAKEIKRLLDYPYGDSIKDMRDRLILELFYATGIRISELVRIKINDIDFKDKLIKIKGKGNKERFVIFGDGMLVVLNDYIDKLSVEEFNTGIFFLFPSHSKTNNLNTHISTRTVFSIVKKYIKNVSKNEKLSPHSIRHSFATHLLESGANVMSVRELLGHASLSSTQIYTHVNIEKIKEEYKKSHPNGRDEKGEDIER